MSYSIFQKDVISTGDRNLIEQQPCPLQKEHTQTGNRSLMSLPHGGHRFFGGGLGQGDISTLANQHISTFNQYYFS